MGQGTGLLGNPWLMIFPKLNQSEIESNLLSSSFCASDYATQISGQGEGDGEGGGVSGCRRGMPRSFSLLGFNFGVNFRFSGAFRWHFICSRMKYEERERAQEGELLVVPCVSLCVRALPLKLQVMMLVCLSVPAPKSQFLPSFPFLLLVLLPFLVRFVFVSPSQFC